MDNTLVNRFTELRRKLLDRSFSGMNSKQREAIFNINGPFMILAGAGSGKTTVIINRIANIINYGNAYWSESIPSGVNEDLLNNMSEAYENGKGAEEFKDIISSDSVSPWNILAITFTNKAANELKERLLSMIGDKGQQVWASTFHATCARILRIYGDKLGYSNHFTIYDSEDTKKLIKDCQKALRIDEKALSFKSIAYEISNAKDMLIGSDEFKKKSGDDFRLSEIAKLYEMYQKHLTDADAMDFDDLITNTVYLFRTCPDVLQKYQEKFKYILVDEYQDTNYAQNVLVNMLAEKYQNLCVVGDDDQSIYKFRGATVENIIDFEKHHKNTQVIRLEQNYRSTGNILNAANSVIKNNLNRKGKTLWTENQEGEKICVHTAYSEHDEANYIVDIIREGVNRGDKYSDFAILYRTNSQSNVIEKIFMKSAVPYRIVGGVRFYERREIRDMIAYLSVINNPTDEIRLKRIVNQPRRSIGERTISQASEIAVETGKELMEIIRGAANYDVLQRVSPKLQAFASIIDSLIEASKDKNVSLEMLYRMVLDKTQYIDFLKNDKEDSESRIENIQELSSNIIRYELENGKNATLSGFLEEVSLLTDVDNYDQSSESVVMMTMHSAKGLEFPYVFLPGFEDGIFPGIQSMFNDGELEEERRLAYVAITRAKKKLYILNSDSRMIFGSTSHNKPSKFLSEIPDEIIEKTKSRDWKKLEPGEEKPRSAQEMRTKSAIAARHFGQITAGVGEAYNQNTAFIPGDFVMHGKFGRGRVVSSTDVNGYIMVEIDFDSSGRKKLMPNYARLHKID